MNDYFSEIYLGSFQNMVSALTLITWHYFNARMLKAHIYRAHSLVSHFCQCLANKVIQLITGIYLVAVSLELNPYLKHMITLGGLIKPITFFFWVIINYNMFPPHRPRMTWFTCPLKAGHAITTSWISHVLPNFVILLDALTNTYLGSQKSTDWDKAEPISKIYF